MSDVQSNVKPLTLTTGRVIFAIAGVYVTQSLVSALSMQSLPALVRAAGEYPYRAPTGDAAGGRRGRPRGAVP